MSKQFPKPFESFEGDIKVKVDWSNIDLWIDTSNQALNSNSDKLKAEINKKNVYKLKTAPVDVDKLDIDKLVLVPVDLNKLSKIVKNYVVRKDIYNIRSRILKIKYLILLT